MHKPATVLLLSLILVIESCNTNNKYSYAIKDFSSSLQPHLKKIVERGYAMYRERILQQMATDEELKRLGKSEHPLLRAAAFSEMLKRPSFNHFEIIINHLDDTALILVDGGHSGFWDETVSDYILERASWKTQSEKDKTLGQVLTKNNYLLSAYSVLERLDPQERYYPYIKGMALRYIRLYSDDSYLTRFRDIEYALYGLAKFKKNADVKIIKSALLENEWQLSPGSFRLLKEFPDTAYFYVLRTHYKNRFYYSALDKATPEDFIGALVMQQSKSSAILLDTILNRLRLQPCLPDRQRIYDAVVMAVWEHPCTAYEKLRVTIEPKAKQILKRRISLPVYTIDDPQIDTTKREFRW